LLCLHQWGAHEHPSLLSPDRATPGNGLLLFFRVDDFDASLKRARAVVARLEEEPHANPSTRTMEFSLRDPDGYYVTISALSSVERGGHEASAWQTHAADGLPSNEEGGRAAPRTFPTRRGVSYGWSPSFEEAFVATMIGGSVADPVALLQTKRRP
jgi:hypothetical protein